jgi:light-regulated signal transduction histidine kinase (bacteriophytochrome)
MLRDLSSFQNYQKQLLSVRGMQKDQTDNQMSRKMFLFALFTVILLLVSFGLIFSELRKRITFQDELERKIEELKRSNSELEQFAYVASHDMQEPLRKIRAFSDMLLIRQRAVLNEDGKSTLQKIAKSSERLQNLINDLLAFSRLVNKNAQNVETVSLDVLLSDVLKDLSILTIEKNAIIEYDHLPTISGVNFQLHQLFLNLISNALKFSKNGIAPHITIRYRLLLGSKIFNIPEVKPFLTYHEITISDNGIGFEQEYADKIFMIFQRLHAKSQFEGTGIG